MYNKSQQYVASGHRTRLSGRRCASALHALFECCMNSVNPLFSVHDYVIR